MPDGLQVDRRVGQRDVEIARGVELPGDGDDALQRRPQLGAEPGRLVAGGGRPADRVADRLGQQPAARRRPASSPCGRAGRAPGSRACPRGSSSAGCPGRTARPGSRGCSRSRRAPGSRGCWPPGTTATASSSRSGSASRAADVLVPGPRRCAPRRPAGRSTGTSASAPSTYDFCASSIRRTSACSMIGTCGSAGSLRLAALEPGAGVVERVQVAGVARARSRRGRRRSGPRSSCGTCRPARGAARRPGSRPRPARRPACARPRRS